MTRKRLRIATLSLLTVLMAMTTLSGCGKRGKPQPPEGKETSFPRQYPSY